MAAPHITTAYRVEEIAYSMGGPTGERIWLASFDTRAEAEAFAATQPGTVEVTEYTPNNRW